jgi:hypothetical protein
MIDALRALPARLLGQLSLLRRDPERFGRNMLQFTDPGLFEQRLIDVMNPQPMHVTVAPGGAPHLNILNPALTPEGMTGGPNTIINLALRIARLGVPVRLVTTVETSRMDRGWFRAHAAQLLGEADPPDLPVVSAADAAQPLIVSPHDVFVATHWTTAQQLKPVLARMAVRRFFYLLQEYEAAFHPWSSNYALAAETYGFDFLPIFNEALLADYMLGQPQGRLAEPGLRAAATIFEPAIEERLFHPPTEARRGPARLLFYARPSNSRNLFGLALLALRRACTAPEFAGWEFRSIGGRGGVPPLELGGGHRLSPAPWLDYAGYARSLREADVLLCPMLSPHTSYPVLEMAASGGLSVTNSFANKTREALEALSENIIARAPTIESMAEALVEAARRTNAGRPRHGAINLPRDWSATLDPAARRIAGLFEELSAAAAPEAAILN